MSRRVDVLALTGVIALATVAFSWRLGASSLFIDETFSWQAASASFTGVFHGVRATEVAPPGYYLLLHFWIGLFGDATEWGMRLMSVLAGVGLVAAVSWLGRLVGGRAAGWLSGLLAAISPLAVQYAQELRAYAFVMVAVTVAVAAALQATRRPERWQRWLTISVVASIASIWLHYTGLLVIVPLLVFVWTSPELTPRPRRAYALSCLVAFVVVAPLMVLQLGSGHQGGVAPFANLTATNLARVIGTPFDGRFVPHALTYVTGAVAVVIALGWGVARGRRRPEGRLILALAVTPVLVVLAITVAAKLLNRHSDYVLITRYTAVATPFMLVLIAWALVSLPRAGALAIAAVLAVSAISGLSYTYSSLWPNLRSPFAAIGRDLRPGDAVVLAGYPAQPGAANYYLARLSGAAAVAPRPRRALTLPPSSKRLWIVSDLGAQPGAVRRLRAAGWRAARNTVFHPGIELTLLARR